MQSDDKTSDGVWNGFPISLRNIMAWHLTVMSTALVCVKVPKAQDLIRSKRSIVFIVIPD